MKMGSIKTNSPCPEDSGGGYEFCEVPYKVKIYSKNPIRVLFIHKI